MRPRTTRRALLHGGGLATVAGLAGCTLKRIEPTPTTTTRGYAQDGQAGDGTPSDGTGDGTDETSPDGDDGQARDGDDGATPTQTAGRTFGFAVTNGITAEDLEPVESLSADTPVNLLIDVEARHEDGTEETVFERRLELPPAASRTIEDAFTTVRYGPQYIVRAVMEKFDFEGPQPSRNRSSALRFTPGGFGVPESTTFIVEIIDWDDEERFAPHLSVREADEE